jgi:hypothetical protein
MNKRSPHRAPDFFVALVVLVAIGFSLTLAVQVVNTDREQVVEHIFVPQNPNAG